MSMYKEIMSLASAMREESTLSKRREAGRRLEQRLTSPRVRQQLHTEAGANRHQAMAELWRFIVPNSVASIQKVAHSKSRLTQADILLVFSIIKCCDIPDENLSPEQVQLHGTFRLTRKEMRVVLNFCLELLNDDEALSVAELDLLDMLAYLAGSRGYMAYLKSQNEMQVILEEVEKRISNESLLDTVRQKAAIIFQNFCLSTANLGMEMTFLVAGCIKIVSEWCAKPFRSGQKTNDVSYLAELSPLIGGLTIILRNNTEQSIAPLARYGEEIFKLVKFRYRRVPDRGQRHLLNQYFLSHLIIAQTAGEIRGLLPGDLGDLGKASLSPRLIDDLLQLVMDRNGELSALSRAGDLETTSLDEIQQTQLELTARLMACGQRIVLCQLEQQNMSNKKQLLFDMIDKLPKLDDLPRMGEVSESFAANSSVVVAKAPFMRHVLKGLHSTASVTLSARSSQPTESHSDGTHLSIIMALKAEASGEKRPSIDPTTTRTLLQIVAACAEAFPSGACWASRSMSCWFVVPNKLRKLENNRHVHGCVPDDLAAVVSVVGDVLDSHGDHNGDAECQKWALRCLTRLANASSCLTLVDPDSDFAMLGKAWQEVWGVIFRSDLRFTSYTTNTAPGSIAEMVLWALAAMIQNICTDPHLRWSREIKERRASFLYRKQGDIWNLPVFTLVGNTSSMAPFDLIVSLLRSVGLSEGSDSVSQGLKFKSFEIKTLPGKTRRLRLVNFCLCSMTWSGDETLLGAAATTLAALSQGDEAKLSNSMKHVCFAPTLLNIPGDKRNLKKDDGNLYNMLWGKLEPLAPIVGDNEQAVDSLTTCNARVQEAISSADDALPTFDILASSQLLTVSEALDKVFDHSNAHDANALDASDTAEAYRMLRSLLMRLKVNLSIFLSRKKSVILESKFNRLTLQIAELFKQVSTQLNFIMEENPAFSLEILRLVEFVVLVTSSEQLDIPNTLLDQSQDLATELEKWLGNYANKENIEQDNSCSTETSTLKHPVSAVDLDDDDLEDRLDETKNRNNLRKRPKRALESSSCKRSRLLQASKCSMKDAICIVLLSFAMKPNLRTLRFAAEKLLGVDVDKPIAYYDSTLVTDPYMAACLTHLFSPMLRLHSNSANSGAALLCRLVLMVRRNTAPHSPLHLFGYPDCADFCLNDGWQGLHSPSQSDAKELLSIWTDLDQAERRSFALRPCVRASSLSSLSKACTGGDDVLRELWGHEYPKQVISSFYDHVSFVRKRAVMCLAGSFGLKPKGDQVIESILRNLPPVSSREDAFGEWYKSLNGDGGVQGRQAWEDARNDVEFFSLYAMALLGGCSTEQARQVSMLFNFVEVASNRCDLEPVCFVLTDLLSSISGFGNAESMLAELLDRLLERWLKRQENGRILKLPLLLSAPSLLRLLIRDGSFCSWNEESNAMMGRLRDHASKEFYFRNSRLALPYLLSSMADVSQPDRRLVDFCSIYDESECQETIVKLIRGHIPSLTAYSAVMRCLPTETEALSTTLFEALRFYGDDAVLAQLKKQHVSSTAKYFIERASFCFDGAESSSFLTQAAVQFSELSGLDGNCGVSDPFRQVGLTLSECCIMSRVWTGISAVDWLSQRRIQNIKVLWSIVCRGTERQSETQLDFLFMLFSDFLFHCRSHHLLAQALTLLRSILAQLTSVTYSARVSHDADSKQEYRVLFCSILRLYEQYQLNSLNNTKAISESFERLKRRSRGLAVEKSFADDTCGDMDGPESLGSGSGDVGLEVSEILNVSSAILQIISENCSVLGLNDRSDLTVCVCESNKAGHTYRDRIHGKSDESDLASFAPEIYSKFTSRRSFLMVYHSATKELPPHQYLLLSDLNHLFQFLSKPVAPQLEAHDRTMLLLNLGCLYSECPDEISAAASRCIGALHCTNDTDLDALSSATWDLGDDVTTDDQLESVLKSKCLDLLVGMVKSPRVSTALIAMETAKVLLSTRHGIECGEVSNRLLIHFVAATKVRSASLSLGSSELQKIKSHFVSKETWVEWCWDELFWASSLDCPFDGWICKLVPAIISCHFAEQSKNTSSAEDLRFICFCQRLSHLESKFAVSLFPLLILQLLREQQSNRPKPQTQIQGDTWIGDPSSPVTAMISKCFAAVLQKCASNQQPRENRAVVLLIDTLDMIRRLEQHRFLLSNGHVRNPITMKAFKDSAATSNTPSQESSPSQAADYPLHLTPVNWAGIPFGVGLFINGMHLAKACLKVKRYCSSMFYAENYADIMFGGSTRKLRHVIREWADNPNQDTFKSSDISGFPVEQSKAQPPARLDHVINEAKLYLELMVECSKALSASDHTDALLAELCDIRLMEANLSLNWQHDRRLTACPSETLRLVDPYMSSRRLTRQSQTAFDCLSELHLFGTLQTSIEGFAASAVDVSSGDKLREMWFEACLFGNDLDSFDGRAFSYTQPSSDKGAGLCESILTALLSFAVDDNNICRIHIDNARASVYESVEECLASEASITSSVSLIDKLHCLNDLDSVVSMDGLEGAPCEWKEDAEHGIILDRTVGFPCRRREQTFSSRVRELVLQHISTRQGEAGSNDTKILSSLLWRNALVSCRSGRTGDAQTAFQRLSRIHGNDPCDQEYFRVRHLEARILEGKGDFSSAIRHVSQSIDRLALFHLDAKHDETKADLMICCGRWMATHRVDSGENVLDKFLRPGLELARQIERENPSIEAAERVTEACIALGDLVFSIFETVAARVKTPEWKLAGTSLATREAELKELDEMVKGPSKKKSDWDQWLRDLLLYRQNLSRDVQQIRAERTKVEKSIDEYKNLAMSTFIEALSTADDSYKCMSKYVYRIVEIWFSSEQHIENQFGFDTIPSYRFVPLANQLFSRLNQSNSLLKRLAKRLCSEHPYHCLSQMVRIGKSALNERDAEKASVANETLASIKEESPEFLSHLIENYENLLESYIYLAEASTETFVRGNTKKIGFSAVYKGRATRLDQCVGRGARRKPCPPCVLTKPPLLRPRCDYGGGIDDPVGSERIDKFDDRFSVAESGITRPKIVVCIGSKGGRFKQLVKGGDDCRGDAVMQQVFEYMNELFAQEKTGRDGELRIVTYNIQPTSATTGVLEWVVDTLPFGDYLNDKGKKAGAHSRYFPGEWGAYLCREYLKNAPRGQKREAFETICKFHSASFRFFFVERFGRSPRDWFEAKTRYTRSVAVSSFVGHILGIGDRHSNNLLVHQKTGEVVHIDFGIVFEQGKLLQVPERVPFRLTRNVVDGFGPTGTEGRFTTSARQTMTALKQNAESLLTILSAITADPLYRWSLNPKVERKRRELLGLIKPTKGIDSGSGEVEEGRSVSDKNEAATQAVRKVKEKLSGYEDGTAGEQQSTEGQVHFLINLARDVEALSQMYPGWAPWS
ncbi:hypothetical protein ACA910_002833 [Epithemia clementina (nom. ined.)]